MSFVDQAGAPAHGQRFPLLLEQLSAPCLALITAGRAGIQPSSAHADQMSPTPTFG